MDLDSPSALAAELRARALRAAPEERADLLLLATEYERLAQADDSMATRSGIKVLLPR